MGRADRDDLHLAAIGIRATDRFRAFLAERIEVDRPKRMVFVDRQVLRAPAGRVVVQAERGVARGDDDAPHAAILGGLQHCPGALNIGEERDIGWRRAWIGNGGEMYHRLLTRKSPFQSFIVGDFSLDVANPMHIHWHPVEDREIAALTQGFGDVAPESAGAAGHDDFLIAQISSPAAANRFLSLAIPALAAPECVGITTTQSIFVPHGELTFGNIEPWITFVSARRQSRSGPSRKPETQAAR